MKPTVSIITVTYNCRGYLEKTLLSIKSQTFRDFEYIVVDGGSTDGTVELIKANVGSVGWWISEKDRGIYDAMNKGLEAAKGTYVLFLNAGDTFYEDTTLQKIPFAQYPAAGIFYGETMITNVNGEPYGLRSKSLPANLNWNHFRRGMVVCHQSILVNKSIAPFYSQKYKYTADYEWVLMALKNSGETVFTQTVISNFSEGGFSAQNQKESWAERFVIMKKHFGLIPTLFWHLVFAVNHLLIFSGITDKYRNIQSIPKTTSTH